MMGLFGFLKKKDIAPPKPFDIGDLKTDLPSIEGLKLPEGIELPSLELPPIENPQPVEFPQNIDLNSRLPGIRHPIEGQNAGQDIFAARNIQPEYHPNEQFADLSGDINQLFLSDPSWKEPDWNEFVPYEEPVIEPPAPQDFPVEETAEETAEERPAVPKDYDLPAFEVLDQTHKPLPQGDLPYDVYVKGPDFKKIIDDINLIKTTLNYQDNMMTDVMDKFKNEAEMLAYNKELMDFLFKKMVYIEKRVFTG
jgi:hypothetical protein